MFDGRDMTQMFRLSPFFSLPFLGPKIPIGARCCPWNRQAGEHNSNQLLGLWFMVGISLYVTKA